MSSTTVKGYFKQTKKGVSKASNKTNPKKTTNTKSKKGSSASFGSDVVQPPSLVTAYGLDLQDEYDTNEKVLRQFDMNMRYGPCIGISRIDRWNRAMKLGLNPPQDVEGLLTSGKVRRESLWDGRV